MNPTPQAETTDTTGTTEQPATKPTTLQYYLREKVLFVAEQQQQENAFRGLSRNRQRQIVADVEERLPKIAPRSWIRPLAYLQAWREVNNSAKPRNCIPSPSTASDELQGS